MNSSNISTEIEPTTTPETPKPKQKRKLRARKINEKDVLDKPKIKPNRIFSAKSQYVELFSDKTKKKIVDDKIKDVQKLKDYKKIHKLLSSPRKKSTRNPCPWPEEHNTNKIFWNTYPFLIKEIQKCVLTNNWNNLTRCLIALKNAPKQYHPYLFKASLINFMVNPASTQNRLLEDFLNEGLGCHGVEDMMKVLNSQFAIVQNGSKDNQIDRSMAEDVPIDN